MPRNVGSRVASEADGQTHQKVTNATSSTSLYDNVASGGTGGQTLSTGGGKFNVSSLPTLPYSNGHLVWFTNKYLLLFRCKHVDTLGRQMKQQDSATTANGTVCAGTAAPGAGAASTGDICTQNHVGSQAGPEDAMAGQSDVDMPKSEGTQAGGPMHQSVGTSTKSTGTRTKEYAEDMVSNSSCG